MKSLFLLSLSLLFSKGFSQYGDGGGDSGYGGGGDSGYGGSSGGGSSGGGSYGGGDGGYGGSSGGGGYGGGMSGGGYGGGMSGGGYGGGGGGGSYGGGGDSGYGGSSGGGSSGGGSYGGGSGGYGGTSGGGGYGGGMSGGGYGGGGYGGGGYGRRSYGKKEKVVVILMPQQQQQQTAAATTGAPASTAAPATEATTGATAAPVTEKKKKSCFEGEQEVMTRAGPMKIKDMVGRYDVEVEVLNESNQLEFSPINYWLHAEKVEPTEYLALDTETGHQLLLTGQHLLYVSPCPGDNSGPRQSIFAGNAQVGQCVLVKQGDAMVSTKLTSIEHVTRAGKYSMVTGSGSIVVNGVGASCYSDVPYESLAHLVFQGMHFLKSLLPQGISEAIFGGFGAHEISLPMIVQGWADSVEKIF